MNTLEGNLLENCRREIQEYYRRLNYVSQIMIILKLLCKTNIKILSSVSVHDCSSDLYMLSTAQLQQNVKMQTTVPNYLISYVI